MAVYNVCTRPCTRAVKVLCSLAENVNTPLYRVHGPCTAVYPVRSRPYTAVYTGRKDDRVHGTRPCTWPCSDHVRPCTGSVHAVNSRVQGRKHARVHDHRVPVVTRPCSGHGRTMYTALARRCIRSVHGRGHVTHVRRVHGHVNVPRVHMPCTCRVYGSCRCSRTRAVTA